MASTWYSAWYSMIFSQIINMFLAQLVQKPDLILILDFVNFLEGQMYWNSKADYPIDSLPYIEAIMMLLCFFPLDIQSYSQIVIGVFNPLLSIVFRFHYHSQEVIGSLGFCVCAHCFLKAHQDHHVQCGFFIFSTISMVVFNSSIQNPWWICFDGPKNAYLFIQGGQPDTDKQGSIFKCNYDRKTYSWLILWIICVGMDGCLVQLVTFSHLHCWVLL